MSRFVPNRKVAAELAKTPNFRRTRRSAAYAVVRVARVLAPDGSPRPGYRETLRVGMSGGEIRAESTDPFAHLVEFGSVNNPPYAPLRRAVRAAGLALTEHPKR